MHIPNGICIEEWDIDFDIPLEISNLIDELKQQNNIIIGYAGNHGIANAINSLVDAMKFFQNENVVLLLIGQGQEKQNLIKKVKEQNVTNVYFVSAVPKTVIPSLLDKLDILYVGLQKQTIYVLVSVQIN